MAKPQLENKRRFTLNSDVNLSEIQVHIDLKDITLLIGLTNSSRKINYIRDHGLIYIIVI